jgi:hypothetical protein
LSFGEINITPFKADHLSTPQSRFTAEECDYIWLRTQGGRSIDEAIERRGAMVRQHRRQRVFCSQEYLRGLA